jgi:hypothetical protein
VRMQPRPTSFFLIFIYTWCALLGNFSHSLAHHLEENKHDHSLACINSALVEGANDEGVSEGAKTSYAIAECSLKLALHNFSSSTSRIDSAFEKGIAPTPKNCEPAHWDKIVILRQFMTVISAQGPPA